MVRRCVGCRKLKNEEAMARVASQRQWKRRRRKKKKNDDDDDDNNNNNNNNTTVYNLSILERRYVDQ